MFCTMKFTTIRHIVTASLFVLVYPGMDSSKADESLPMLHEMQVIKAEIPASRDYFGWNLALDGDTAVIAKADGDTHRMATIYKYNEGAWESLKSVSATVIPEDGSFPEVDLDGDILLLSEDSHDESDACAPNGHCGDTGLVYVFERDLGGIDNWGLRTTLNGGHKVGSSFGSHVAIDGETAAIAAYSEDGGSASTQSMSKAGEGPIIESASVINVVENSGAIYLFERNEGGPDQWGLVQRLELENPKVDQLFGANLMLVGNTLIAETAPGWFDTNLAVFQRSVTEGASWELVQEIEVPTARIRYEAFDGMTLVHSSFDEDAQLNTYYFYERGVSGTWELVQTLQNIPGHGGLGRGGSLALDHGQLIETFKDGDVVARIFEKNGTTGLWELAANLGVSTIDVPERPNDVAVDSGRALVSGMSETESNNREGEVLAYEVAPPVNTGHAGAWYNPDTSGQGQLIDIEPENQFMFIAWFTYTDTASTNPNQQHWFTAQGNYSGNAAELVLYETLGGRFDNSQEVSTDPVGSVNLSFSNCGSGTLSYAIDSSGLQGSFPLSRAIPGTENVCQELAGDTTESLDKNDGWDGAWYDENSPGQGFLIDVHPSAEGDDFIFVAWFTYGEDSVSGQRWLTTQGPLQGTAADIVVYETTGGSFDKPITDETIPVGSMTINFTDCSNALLTYSLTDEGLEGSIEIKRAIPGTEALCQALNGQKN